MHYMTVVSLEMSDEPYYSIVTYDEVGWRFGN